MIPIEKVKRGRFITFEGGEGSGKTTQSKKLFERLKAAGIDVLWTREPGGSQGAEEIRALLVKGDANRWASTTESLLMFAARDDHWKTFIEPALNDGKWVICDRFADSSYAYQGYGKKVPLALLDMLYQYTVGDRKPDRTYLFDISIDIGLERAHARMSADQAKEDRFEGLGTSFHERVRTGFREISSKDSARFHCLDAMQSIEILENLVWQDVQCLMLATVPG
ncbi:MAG: dTMP kinase [Candidatus Paracaedibacteraceae bacterium]|nr:dTMP kinase [Candidatus Paracaedibacteraceae bacterium]